MIRGHLKLVVLMGLSQKAMTGYDLMKHINETIGIKPSPGSMYPLLKSLEEMGLIKAKETDKKKIFSLTAKGKKKTIELMKAKEDFSNRAIKGLKLIQTITGEKHEEYEMAKLHLKNHMMIKELNPELSEFRETFLSLLNNKKKMDKKKTEIKKFLKKSNETLKKIMEK